MPANQVAEFAAQSQQTFTRRMSADDVKRGAVNLLFISLCGGPVCEDGMKNCVREWNAHMDVSDLVRSSEHDIADEDHRSEQRASSTGLLVEYTRRFMSSCRPARIVSDASSYDMLRER